MESNKTLEALVGATTMHGFGESVLANLLIDRLHPEAALLAAKEAGLLPKEAQLTKEDIEKLIRAASLSDKTSADFAKLLIE